MLFFTLHLLTSVSPSLQIRSKSDKSVSKKEKRIYLVYLKWVFHASAMPSLFLPFLLRFKSVPNPIQIRSKSAPMNGRKMGLTRDLLRSQIGTGLLFS